MSKVVIGLSGGVDSSVAAYLLKEQGHEVIGLFMKNWDDASVTLTSSCTWEDDWFFAQQTAKKIGIELHFIDLSKYYRQRVVNYMFDEYSKGRTPNPDVLCNREIKFDLFIDEAIKLGAEFIATGHYCRKQTEIINGKSIHKLLAGIDNNKDQSYFLCQLSQKQLKKALFPIGELTKPEVRKIAEQNSFATATRKDSQGICFVGKVDLPVFLQQKLEAKEGNIIEIPKEYYSNSDINNFAKYEYKEEDGIRVGKHKGAHFYTIGQRKGLNIGGSAKPLYVIATDIKTNTVFVGCGDEHPGLYRKGIIIKREEIHWIREDLMLNEGEEKNLLVRIRYRQPLQDATLFMGKNTLKIRFNDLQRGIASGQFAAWYDDDELLDSGVIS